MSKNLRVFLLSVLVILLGISSNMAAALETIEVNAAGNDDYYTYSSSGDLKIRKDAIFTFASPDIEINSLDVSGSGDKGLSEVIIRLPRPGTDEAGHGTKGAWNISFPSKDINGNALSSTNRAKITIEQGNVHAAVITSDSVKWEVPAYVDFTLNAPVRIEEDGSSINLSVTVSPDAKMTFGKEGQIYGSSGDVRIATGFLGGNSGDYTVAGEMIIQNIYAIKGSALSADVKSTGILTFDIEDSTEIDTRGITSTAGALESDGATINVNGGTIQTLRAHTFIGKITSTTGTVKKKGAGALTIAQKSSWPAQTFSSDVKNLQVDGGGLILTGKPSWQADGATALASGDANTYFTANEKSINEKGDSFDIKVGGSATATFANHALYKGNEIYPYDDFINKHDGLTIKVTGVNVYTYSNAKFVVEDGAFPVENITGNGTVQINGDPSADKAVLILTSPDADTSGFTGTITGTGANLGLYYTQSDAKDKPFKNASLLPSADKVVLDNILVYGPAVLQIDDKTEIKDGVKAIWLRGNRPGALNYVDGEVNKKIANSQITIGGLLLAPSDEVIASDPSKDSVIELTDLKIDGTANDAAMATITMGERVYATVSNIALYVNKDVDFNGAYVEPAKGIYALTIDGSTQPSRLVIDGATVTGEGVAADLVPAEEVYQFQMTDNSDVRFLGDNGNAHHPIGKNTSLYVGQDAKLEMGRGAIIDGNIEFKGSSTAVGSSAYAESGDYPQESWFASGDNRWNDPSLDAFATFTTVVAKNNRVNGSPATDTSEYAVKVGGNVTFSTDVSVQPSTTAYPGRVLVRTKTHTNAFEGVTQTTLNRFRSIGSTSSSSTYRPDFLTPYDSTYAWRVTPLTEFQATGVVVETRNEYARLNIGEFSFTKGADTFGNGEFVAKATVTAWALGDELTITSPDTTATGAKYMLVRGSNEKYYIEDAEVYFRRNVEGEEEAESNVFDEGEWSTTFSSHDILMNGNFRLADDGTPEIELRGYSYGGNTLNDVTVMLKFTGVSGNPHTLKIKGVLPAYKTAPLSPSGLGDKFSKAETYANEPFSFIDGNNGIVSFTVVGMQKSAASTTSSYELVNGVYTWNVKAVEGAYLLPDENGSYARIENLRLIRYNGTNYSDATPVTVEENPVLTPEGNTMIVSAASSALGDTGDAFVATKWLALRGDTSDGTLTTNPVAYTLFKATSPDNIITGKGTLDQTVLIGGDPVSGQYEVTVNDGFSGDITLQPVNLPSWLGYNGGGGMISYQTGDLTGVKPGVHTFQVVAYDEEGNHKIYQFTVTVTGELAPVVPHIEPEEETTTVNVVTGETQTVTLTFVSGDATTVTWSFTPEGIPGLLTGVANGNTYTLTVNANGVEPGSYAYVISVNDGAYTRNVTVVVTAAAFEVADEPNDATYEGYNYRNVVTAAGATGKVTWTVTPARASDTWLTWVESGDDQLVLAGVLPDYDDGEDADNDHVFRITASVGTVYADNASTEEPYEITVSVEEDTMLPVSASADIVRPAEGVALGSVDKNYSVTVVFPTDPDEEGTVVASDYILDETSINLPEWISYKVISRDDNDDVLAIRLVVNPVPGVANGTKGTVRIPADGVTLGWNVVYNAASPLEITASPVAVSFDSPTAAAKTVTLSATNAIGTVTYTASVDKTGLTAAVSGDVLTLTPSAAGSYTVTVTGSTATQTATATVNVTVNSGTGPTPGSFSITATPASVSFDSPTASAQTVTLSTNFLGATVTYTASVDKTGLSADVSGDVLTLTPSAAGTYTVTVTGTNGTNTATATVNVTVNSGTGPTPTDFSISVSRSSVTFDSPTASAQTVTLSTNFLGATVTYSAAVSPATGLTASVSGTTLTLTPSAAGTYVVTVTGTNGTRTATATVNVTVSSGPSTTFSISATPSTVTFTSVSAAVQTVTLSATGASGSVTYSADVTASSTGSTGLTDGLDLTVSGNTLTIDPLEAGTYTVTITGNTTTQTATTTITVVVTSAVARVGSSGGGCDAGFGALALVLAAPLFLRRRRS